MSEAGSLKILIVEDEPQVQRVLAQMLQRKGYSVILAACVKEALCEWENHKSDIAMIVTDNDMPDPDHAKPKEQLRHEGIRLINEIRKDTQGAHLPVLLLSGRHDPDLAALSSSHDRLPESASFRFLPKPLQDFPAFYKLIQDFTRYTPETPPSPERPR